ncbi:MAG: ABC transporter permease [Eubacterium sp.]|nr:ABC transporter permease [Eubacterium sp.]
MIRFVLERLAQSVIVLFLVTIVAFGMINAAPGEPAAALYGGQLDRLTQQEVDRINENLGLNRPVAQRYAIWLGDMLHGEMGVSYSEGRSVNAMIADRLPNTLVLFFLGMTTTVLLAVLLGMAAGLRQGSLLDRGLTAFSLVINCIPSFLVALFCIFVFSVHLHWLPSAGTSTLMSGGGFADRLKYLVLPVAVIICSHVGSFARFIQERIKEESGSYYVMVAKANRVAQRKIDGGILKNALVPCINYIGSHVPSFFSGFVVIETVFAYTGMGSMLVKAIALKDYPVLMGSILVIGVVVVIGMFCVDMIAMILNPRMRREVL